MAKTSANYETIFIISPELNEEGTADVVARFRGLIESEASVEKVDEWGKRRLAYPINDLTEGYYVYIKFGSKPDFPAELDRVYKITDTILRSMIIALD